MENIENTEVATVASILAEIETAYDAMGKREVEKFMEDMKELFDKVHDTKDFNEARAIAGNDENFFLMYGRSWNSSAVGKGVAEILETLIKENQEKLKADRMYELKTLNISSLEVKEKSDGEDMFKGTFLATLESGEVKIITVRFMLKRGRNKRYALAFGMKVA